MVSTIRLRERPELFDPVLIEGLPGIGLVANLAVGYLIRRFDARLFGEVIIDSFPDIVVVGEGGSLKSPFCRLYYCKREADIGYRDLILVYGNTQALTRRGQYELCGVMLDVAEEVGCKYVITLGGFRPGRPVRAPNLYFTASNLEMVKWAESVGAEILKGRVFGVAGLLIGLAGLRKINGLCLLAETPGTHPDKEAAISILKALSTLLHLNLTTQDLKDVGDIADFLSPFDFGVLDRKKGDLEAKPGWFI